VTTTAGRYDPGMATDRARRRPTIDDVATLAGVSRGTVSRVLNGGHWVSPDSLAAVTAAIKKTGYRINPHARTLATSKTNTVAFLLTEPYHLLFEDPNFSVLMRAAAAALDQQDISLVLIMASNEDEQRRAVEFIGAGHVDGVLLVSSHANSRTFLQAINRIAVPTISCGIPIGFERRLGSVSADDKSGAEQAVQLLRQRGRTRIAHIAGPSDTPGGVDRLAGYRSALGDDFDPELVAEGDYGRESGARAMRALLETAPDLDAVFVANDRMAAAAIEVLGEAGRRVPQDVSVVGFDDAPMAAETNPPLTTMRQPFERISREMVRMLLEEIDGEPPATMTVPTQLIERESA
jgi:DNA-binding LacI/PurR family transcriptional regulator